MIGINGGGLVAECAFLKIFFVNILLLYMSSFSITQSAKQKISCLISEEDAEQSKENKAFLRIEVLAGGCSGLQYKMDITRDFNPEEDKKFENLVVIDGISLQHIEGSVLDYEVSLGAAHFSVKNPKATANCGCGNSFAL